MGRSGDGALRDELLHEQQALALSARAPEHKQRDDCIRQAHFDQPLAAHRPIRQRHDQLPRGAAVLT